MATPQKASTAVGKNKQDSKNNSRNGTKKPGSIHVPRQQSTSRSTIPPKPSSSRAMATSTKTDCTTNLPPIMAGTKTVSHNLRVNPNSSGEIKATEHVANLTEKMGQTVILTNTEKNTEKLTTVADTSGNKTSGITTNWLPQMDGIEIALPSSKINHNGSRATTNHHEMKMNEEMAKTEAYIQDVLYGKGVRRRRLPVFEEICPSELFPEYCRD